MSESEERAVVLSTPTEVQPTTPQLPAQAIAAGQTPETLARMMDLHERWEATEARKAFTSAMAEFKRSCPGVITKD